MTQTDDRTLNNKCQSPRTALSSILANAGAGFVLVRRPGEPIRTRDGRTLIATGKEPLSRSWQKRACTLTEAMAHARRGGNVGVLGGHNNLILLDADADADAVEQAEPRLRDTIKITRSTAPDRAKWIVRVEGEIPRSQKSHGKLEILAAGTQGVVAGRHHSGARLEFSGDRIVTLTAGDIAALWRTVVGEELTADRASASSPPDAEAMAASMRLVDTVLEHGGVARSAWREYQDGGRILTMETCPFVEKTSEPHRQHSTPHKAFVFVTASGQINAGCQAARCQHAIAEHGGSGWALLKEIVGWTHTRTPEVDLEHQRQIIEALMEWVRRADLAEHVPIVLQSATGYRTRDTDTDVALAILSVAHMHARTTRLLLPMRKLRELTNLGSLSTVRNALARLDGWFIVGDDPPQNPNDARTYSINPALLETAQTMIDVAQIERVVTNIENSTSHVTTRSIYATLPLATHLHRDAFSSVQRPITEEELQARIDARNEEIAAGVDVRPIDRRRYRRRLAAALPSLGRTVLRLIDYLVECDGTASRTDLRVALNLSPSALSRAVARAKELGVVSADRTSVSLHAAWSELIDAFEPYMPTANRGEDRIINDLDATLRYINIKLRQAGLDAQEERRLQRRRARAHRRKTEIAAHRRPDLPHAHADAASPTAYEHYMRRKMADRHAIARLDLAAERRADSWRLVSEARRLRADGVSKRDAWRMLEFGGWQRSELYSVMSVVWPQRGNAHGG